MRAERIFAGRIPSQPRRALLRSLRLATVLGLALAVTGCESLENLNPFDQKQKKLPGERHPVFPEGVPGVDYSTGPGQPSNANATIDLPPQAPAATPNTGAQR